MFSGGTRECILKHMTGFGVSTSLVDGGIGEKKSDSGIG